MSEEGEKSHRHTQNRSRLHVRHPAAVLSSGSAGVSTINTPPHSRPRPRKFSSQRFASTSEPSDDAQGSAFAGLKRRKARTLDCPKLSTVLCRAMRLRRSLGVLIGLRCLVPKSLLEVVKECCGAVEIWSIIRRVIAVLCTAYACQWQGVLFQCLRAVVRPLTVGKLLRQNRYHQDFLVVDMIPVPVDIGVRIQER